MINEQEIRKWWDLFHPTGDLTEIRIIGAGKTFSGYFTDIETLLADLRRNGGFEGMGIYAPFNVLDDAVGGRSQRNQILTKAKLSTTSDTEIIRRRFFFIDIDPERPSDTNATDEQKTLAWAKCIQVRTFLRNEGFNEPVVVDSANGYHLFYKIDVPNNAETTEAVKNAIKALNILFGDEHTKIDEAIFNAARIAKIPGTQSAKGAINDPIRPRRMSWFVEVPQFWRETDFAFVHKIAALIPEEEKPSRFNGYRSEKFDLESFISEHDIKVAKRTSFHGGIKFVLDECPFNPNHKAPDSALFQMDSGAVGFRCLHASCSHFNWRDFRLHYDPSAYDASDRAEYRQKRSYYGRVTPPPEVKIIENEDERGPKWMQMGSIRRRDLSQLTAIPFGIPDLDKKLMGQFLGDLTIWSGGSGAGKTTMLNHLVLNSVQRGFKSAIFSGELQDFRFLSWLDQMAAGKSYVVPVPGYEGIYNARPDIAKKINAWLGDRVLLYNNAYGSKWSQLFADVKKCVVDNQTQIVFIDNLMALQLDAYQGDKNERQTQFINDLKDLAKSANIHIVLVCHPRKEDTRQLLRKESIAGTADLTNLCDNLILMHRVGRDFEKKATEFFGAKTAQELMDYDIVLEVAKNRSLGVVDYVLGLYYEPETRRILNDPTENIVYGWDDQPASVELPGLTDDDDLPL